VATLDVARSRGALLGGLVGGVLASLFEGHPGVVPVPDFAFVLADEATSTLAHSDDTAMTMGARRVAPPIRLHSEDDLSQAFAEHWARTRRR